MTRFLSKYRSDESGAIAAIYAIALFGLVGIAGVGWDYGRMMAMDSELQNAADQAALAAATQLNGRAGAITRAEAAARTYLATASSDYVNVTRMANDGDGRAISDLSFTFYESYNSATDAFGTVTTADAAAKVVRVVVNGREAFFALTPIVGLISSGDIAADAVAGLEAAACNVPPLMFCAPSGRADFPNPGDIGTALSLRQRVSTGNEPNGANDPGSGSEDLTPGNFDLLNIPYDNIASNDRNRSLGLNTDYLGCTGGQTQTRPGAVTPQTRAIDTRFDIYPTNGNNISCQGNGDFCPAQVVRNATLVREMTANNANSLPTCAAATSSDYDVVAASSMPSGYSAADQQLPLDDCLLSGGNCQSFGNGVWNFNQYMANVHPGASTTGIDANNDGRTTRHEVYNWERADASRRTSRQIGADVPGQGNRVTRYCTHPTPASTAVVPSATQKDRRVLTVASVDCSQVLNGRVNINSIIRWVDLFLISPSNDNGGNSNIYAEVVGPALRADGGTGFQNFGRNKPVLLR